MKSIVIRSEDHGRVCYSKQYLEDEWGATPDIIRRRAAREADVIERLAGLDEWPDELGRLKLLSSNQLDATVVTEEIPGIRLVDFLEGGQDGRSEATTHQPLRDAGKWLRRFQRLSVEPGEGTPLGDSESSDLTEYCDIRLSNIQGFGYRWMSEQRRKMTLDSVTRLVAESDAADSDIVWSHNDFHPGNAVWDGTCLTVIDFGMCAVGCVLLDAATFLHRLELMPVTRPWKRYPIAAWKKEFLAGYERPDAESSSMYKALALRLWICRLQTLLRRPATSTKQRIHNSWVRLRIRREIESRIGEDGRR